VTLLLVCSPDRVSGIWQEAGVTMESRFLSRNSSDSAVELLHWLASVLFELRKQRQAPAPTGATTAGGAGAGVVSQPPPAPDPALEATSTPQPAAVAPESTAAEASEPAVSTTASSVDASTRGSSSWTLALAATYAHFGTEIPGALGPQAAFSYLMLPRLELRASTDVRIGLGSSDGFGMFDVGFSLGVSYGVLPFLSLALAPRLVLTTFSFPRDTTGVGAPVVAGGALFLARGRLPWRPLHPFLDLGVEALTPAREATLDGTTVLRVPQWQGIVALGVELPL